jgi:hypothetical protein
VRAVNGSCSTVLLAIIQVLTQLQLLPSVIPVGQVNVMFDINTDVQDVVLMLIISSAILAY